MTAEEIRRAIESAPTDSSGVENVFTAVKQIMTVWSSYRTEQNRRIMLITITDEAGDDEQTEHDEQQERRAPLGGRSGEAHGLLLGGSGFRPGPCWTSCPAGRR